MATSAPVLPAKRKVTSTVVTETIPSGRDAQPEAFYDGDPWEVIARIHREAEHGQIPWAEHMARVYRVTDRGDSESVPENNKFTEPFDVDSLRERFGGGRYKIWIYGPPERSKLVVRPFVVTLDGAAKESSRASNGTAAAGEGNSVAMEAMRLYANPEFIRMQMQMMVTAATEAMALIKSQIPTAQDPLQTLRNAKEILGPPASADSSLLTHITLLKELGLIGSPEKKGISEVLETLNQFKTAGLIPAAVPKADLGTTFATHLPMLVDRVVAGLHEFRLTAEAERDAKGARVIDMPPTPPEKTAPAANGTAAASASSEVRSVTQVTPEVAQAIIAQAHLHRLVTGIKNPKSTGQDMYDYLVNAWPEVLDELAKMNAPTLLAFFKSRDTQMQYFQTDILTEVANDPRLPKIIEDFLRIAKDEAAIAAAETVAASTAAVV